MPATTIVLTAAQHRVLCEALRRFECFGVRSDGRRWTIEDMQQGWTGLGPPSVYRAAVGAAYMRTTHLPEIPRVSNWYSLTETGAKIVLAWHKAGYGCPPNEYTLAKTPPRTVEIHQD
jgi:hypothetical protein